MSNFKRPKLIFDPILGRIDVTDILPFLDVKEFQSLGFKYQLGLTATIFPAATHTRKEHCLGAYERTRRLTENWRHQGFINEVQAKSLCLYALYHDIGHGPFSHVTETLGKINHDERSLKIIERLKDRIETSGFDYKTIRALFSHEDPLYLAVFDKNLGAEKLDYLERDAFYTLGERPGVEYLAKHIYYIDGQVVIDEVVIDQAKAVQDFYIRMSKHVYLRKKAALLQRLFEKMTHFLMRDGLTEAELFNLTDFGLLGRFEISKNSQIQFYYQNFLEGAFPKLTLEIKDESFVPSEILESKLIKIIGLAPEKFDSLISAEKLHNLEQLEDLEKRIANLTGIPEGKLIIVPPQSKKRFEPEDIKVLTHDSKIKLISEIYPNHFEAMREFGRSHLSLRIGVYGEFRRNLYSQADKVRDFLLS